MDPVKTVLSIAGYDPSSGAGITADLIVFAAHGLFGTSCITALTVQSTMGVHQVHPVAAEIVGKTLQYLDEDTPPAGIKIGMMGTSDNVRVISEYIEGLRSSGQAIPVVVDPVIESSSGARLLDSGGFALMRERLLGVADWVTPNIGELEVLSDKAVGNAAAVPDACRILQERILADTGQRVGICAKGGHLRKPDDYLLDSAGEGVWVPGEWVRTSSTHGTGCAFSSAFLSRLVLGDEPPEAVRRAKEYVQGALENAVPTGKGAGPMKYLWQFMDLNNEE
ncbi:MAG TPA: bifunctional hydroxymethylpyrimidine kinase/phosphomethylpyrimidine kinase [Acidobacteriaceae bacterium]|jgi:hydroxymethylpyrimidine/phosphomethylpyrimidine kinase|nr:bifunctional hydroxymethylpyrimidine kinase/phosphomethylpyrimidine kinase [Acidobacteriaceae bacterium]